MIAPIWEPRVLDPTVALCLGEPEPGDGSGYFGRKECHQNGITFYEWFWGQTLEFGTCWEWQRARFPTGYGHVVYEGVGMYAHRVAWLLVHGVIRGMILHHCDNPPCIRPSHLYDGTSQDNANDRGERNPYFHDAAQRLCQQGHQRRREGTRGFRCMVCHLAYMRRRYAANRDAERLRARRRYYAKKGVPNPYAHPGEMPAVQESVDAAGQESCPVSAVLASTGETFGLTPPPPV